MGSEPSGIRAQWDPGPVGSGPSGIPARRYLGPVGSQPGDTWPSGIPARRYLALAFGRSLPGSLPGSLLACVSSWHPSRSTHCARHLSRIPSVADRYGILFSFHGSGKVYREADQIRIPAPRHRSACIPLVEAGSIRNRIPQSRLRQVSTIRLLSSYSSPAR